MSEMARAESTATREVEVLTDDEALSFCDLALNTSQATQQEPKLPTSETNFEFASWALLLAPESVEMCAADDIFSDGQLLPFRPSVSSEKGLLDTANSPVHRSRSESPERSWTYFTSSSRGSSSSSRGSCSFDLATEKRRASADSCVFLSTSSPKPVRRMSFPGGRREETSKMGIFRLGPMTTPEIQLEYLKQRLKRKDTSQRRLPSSPSSSLSSSWKVLAGLDCRCSAVDTVSSAITRRKEARRVEKGDETEEEMRIRSPREKNEPSRVRELGWLRRELPFARRA